MNKVLTALACGRLQSGTLTDARSPGLRLVATAGKKSWIYRYRLQTGPLRQFKLGEFARMTLAEARELWAEQKKIRDRSLDPRIEKEKSIQAEAEKIQAAYSVDEMAEDWVRLHATKLARGDEMERLLRREVLPRWKGRAAPSITRRDCVDLFEAVSARAPRVAEQMMSAVRSAFSLALERARLDMANPAVGVGGMKRAERKLAFTDLELKKFLPWLADASLSSNVRDVMRLTLLTACRSGEAVQCGMVRG
jgi:Arm domain-containing DNA-binding protein